MRSDLKRSPPGSGSRANRVLQRSQANGLRSKTDPPPIILVDSIGELSAIWGLADVAFVEGACSPAAAVKT